MSFHSVPRAVRMEGDHQFPVLMSDFITDSNEEYNNLAMDKKLITEGVNTLSWKDSYKISQYRHGQFIHLLPKEFTYGYAITCHKSQRK